jgi:hypothetical protein
MSDRILMLAVSRDGCHNWGNWRFIPLGEVGKYNHTLRALRFGMSRQWSCRVRITSPVKTNIHGLLVDMEAGD